jgi:serine/threonine-protein kinase RsbW
MLSMRRARGRAAVVDDNDAAGAAERDPQPIPLKHRRYVERLRLVLPSTTDSLNLAVRRCLKVAKHCGFGEDARTDLEIALREALANAIIHGNKQANGTSFFVRCYAAPREGLLVLVRDEGAGFDPDAVPDPRSGNRIHLSHGRGLFLMKQLVDRMEYRRGGREVLLFKTC